MRRIFILPILLVLVTVLLIGLVNTGSGLRVIGRIVQPMVPGQFSYETLNGRLIGPIQVSSLSWSQDGSQLTVETLDIEWQLSRILSRHLYIERLYAAGVHWIAPESDTKKTAPVEFTLPRLPLTVTIDDLLIDRVLIDQGTNSVAIDSLGLAAQLDDDHYRLVALSVRSPLLDISGNASVGIDTPHALDAALSWTVKPDIEMQAIEGTTTASGDTETANFKLTADGPFSLQLTGLVNDLLGQPRLNGDLNLKDFNPNSAGLEFESGPISADLSYRIALDGLQLNGRLLAAELWPGAVIIDSDTRLIDDTVEIKTLSLKLENLPTAIDANGTLQTDLSALDLNLGWKNLLWPLTGEPQITSPSGNATVTGSKDRYTLRLDGSTDEGLIPAAQIALRGQGTTTQFEIREMKARFDPGQLSAQGSLDWADQPTVDLQVQSKDLDLSRWNEQLEGQVGFQGTVRASLPPEGARATVVLRSIDGQLRGYALSGAGAFDYTPEQMSFREIDVRAGQARFEANGSVGDTLDVSWKLNVPDIALFVPGGSGAIQSQGSANGPRSQPGLNGSLKMQSLKLATFKAASVDSEFQIGIDANAVTHARLDATGVELGQTLLGTINGQVDGTVAQHTIEIKLDGDFGKLDTAFNGGYTDNTWQGNVSRLIANHNEVGIWQLADTSQLTINREKVAMSRLCLAQGDSQLCAVGDVGAKAPWRTDIELKTLPVETFAPFFPPGLIFEGTISGQGFIASTESAWAGTASLQFSDGRVMTREDDEEDVLIGYENGLLEASLDATKIQARLKLDLRDAGAIDADVTYPIGAGEQLKGTVQARIENLSIVPALLPQVGRIDGRLDANLKLAGTLVQPDLTGHVGLVTTELVLPEFGITMKDAKIELVTEGNALRFAGSASSGEGQVSLNGDLLWQQGKPRGQIKLTGEKFRAIDLPEVWLDASPNLALTVAGREIEFSGDVTVPAARVTPIDLGTGIAVTQDQIIVGETAASDPESGWRIKGSLQVTAGDEVHISGFGLDGNLKGSVLITEAPNQPTRGRGALEVVDGRYRAYGQELTIETGRLDFTGGQIDDPGISVRAVRTAGDVTAGVQVRGALRRPVLTLYSVPAMSDTQAMSYLITGRGLEELNEIDQTAVSDAAARLALRGGSLLASSLGRGLGLDSVEFEDSGTATSTSLVVGKHLSPRLFVSYGIGLFEAINTIRLRYRINSRLTLETQSGTRTSADLLYSVER